jgi:sporulation protein YlmC with PRC-barrel domain
VQSDQEEAATMARDDLAMWQGKTVIDPDGDKIGTVDDLFVDEDTREPEWLLVDPGVFGKNRFVPARDAGFVNDDAVQVPYGKDQVKNAPDIDAADTLSGDDEQLLYDHYGISSSDRQPPRAVPDEGVPPSTGQEQGETAGGQQTGLLSAREQATPAPGTGEPSSAASGSEDYRDTQTSESPSGSSPAGVTGRERVRVKKRIVTEPRTVYVEREEIVVEREPMSDERADDTSPSQEGVREEVLYEDEITPEHEVDQGEENAA